ncbi:T9SS type A sorting domain-containing protein [Aquimarina sp. RZ0]|uniref:VPS10 domain-containing protein n=1 Tax=Aquimarina sp. RZ0 TaxID=2607730 RepID=UPI0011F317EF|nr:T9SS type A sorting domain-containing protein [Aquimarina sp. RZ0]KAA1243493.1 T9SS type A sorting domain-containing protein [Aquimarina sp. RZ0]
MKHFLRILTLFLLIYYSSNAQLDTKYFDKLKASKVTSDNSLNWVQFGPGMSGYIEFFWCHPTDPNVMHMSPDMFNVYGSFDRGESWQTIKDYDGLGSDMGRTYDIEFSRQDPNLGFAIDELGGLFKTTNKGRSWVKTSFSLGKIHSEIAVDPSNDNNWYIGAGSFWDVKTNHRTAAKPEGILRRNSATGHIYKSTNKGSTWKKINKGLPNNLNVAKIIVDPRNSNNIILAGNTGVYRSIDKGETWVPSKAGLPNNLPKDMTSYFDKTQNKFILYLVEQTKYIKQGNTTVSKGGIFKSTNSGKNWTSITGDLGLDLTKVTHWTTRSKYKRAVSHWLGIPKSQVGKFPSKTLQTFHRIRVNPKNPKEIYISHNTKHDFSFGPAEIWKTENGGTTWFPTARYGKYWKTNQDKNYWTSRNKPVGMNTSFAHLQHEMETAAGYSGCRALDINSEGEVFTSIEQQVLKSKDGGKTWKQIDDIETASGSKNWIGKGDSNLPGRYMLLETGVSGRKLFCSGEHGLWKSAPSGNNSNPNVQAVTQIEGQVNNPKAATSTAFVAVHPKNPDILYTLQFRQDNRDNFRRSTDGGRTWENISTPIDYPDTNLSNHRIFPYSILIDPEQPKIIYFCVIKKALQEVNGSVVAPGFNKFGVYKSIDGGFNWKIMNAGLPSGGSVRRLAMDPKNSNVIYAAMNQSGNVRGGLYKTTNKAGSWKKVTIPSSIKSVNNIHINKATNHLYISCGSKSGKDTEGGIWRSKNNGASWEKIFDLPYVWQTETSPINPDIIIASAPRNTKRPNPGAYLSRNGGQTWIKVNKNLAHANAITDIRPDNMDENVFWCAGWGSGWYKGILKNGNTKETLKFNNFPSKIFPSKRIDVQVDYNVSQRRQISIVLNTPDGRYVTNTKQIVEAGSGSVITHLSLPSIPEIAKNYIITTSIRPVGGNFNSAVLRKKKTFDIVTESVENTATLSPIQDAYLQGNKRFNTDILRIEANKRTVYLMFDISSIKGTITKAELRFTVYADAGNGNLIINKGNDNRWTENNISNSNKPIRGPQLGNLNINFPIGSVKTIPLKTAEINGDKLSLILNALSGNDFSFASKENSKVAKPELVITYTSSRDNIDNEDDIMMFPNPVLNTLNFSGELENKTIRIFNMLGALQKEIIIRKGQTSVDMSAMQNGFYMLKVIDIHAGNKILLTKKVLKLK